MLIYQTDIEEKGTSTIKVWLYASSHSSIPLSIHKVI